MQTEHPSLQLAHGLSFDDLYNRDGLVKLDAIFLRELAETDAALAERLAEARKAGPDPAIRKQQSELVVELAPHVEDFIGELFGIQNEIRALQARHDSLAPIYSLKRKFVQKKAISGVTAEKAAAINGPALAKRLTELFGEPL